MQTTDTSRNSSITIIMMQGGVYVCAVLPMYGNWCIYSVSGMFVFCVTCHGVVAVG